jgi:predicted PurR-regulated permease PerM
MLVRLDGVADPDAAGRDDLAPDAERDVVLAAQRGERLQRRHVAVAALGIATDESPRGERRGRGLPQLERALVAIGLLGAAAFVVDAALVVVVALYFSLDARRARVAGLRAVPFGYRRRVRAMLDDVGAVLGAYIRGQLLLAGTLAVMATAVLLVARMPYALVLGVFAGIAELIPMFGPFIGAVPAVAIAAGQPFPTLVGYFIVQQLEAHVLVPRISGDAVGIRPVVALLALIGGFEVGGVLGALFAVPVAGVAWVFVTTAMRAYRGRRTARAAAPRARRHVA